MLANLWPAFRFLVSSVEQLGVAVQRLVVKITASTGLLELYHAGLAVFMLFNLELESHLLCELLVYILFDITGELDAARCRAFAEVVTVGL